MTYQPHHSEDVSLKTVCDNPRVLCQDCSRPLFRWFLSRIDWRRILKQMTIAAAIRKESKGEDQHE
jgi:hypothetical protein